MANTPQSKKRAAPSPSGGGAGSVAWSHSTSIRFTRLSPSGRDPARPPRGMRRIFLAVYTAYIGRFFSFRGV